MADVSLGTQDTSSKGGPPGSDNPVAHLLQEHSFTEHTYLRSVIEEYAFLSLSEGSLIRKPHYKYSDSDPDEDNDFHSMSFPRKLWKIVESKQLKSIWWNENGTSIIIDEELFKKEVLERKAPFKIFETGSMKSLIRQLNLYGFSKLRQTFQRSASLHDFLEEEKTGSMLSKLQCYQNPNFKKDSPHLLLRMKRRVGMKNASQSFASGEDFNKHFRAKCKANTHNSSAVAGTSKGCMLPNSTPLNMPQNMKPASSHKISHAAAPVKTDFASSSSILVRPSKQVAKNENSMLNPLPTFHMHSHCSYTQANGPILNLNAPTTSNFHSHIVPHLQRSYLEPVLPSNFPIINGQLSNSTTGRKTMVPNVNDS